MSTTIKWSLNVEIGNGPKVSVSRTTTVHAYGKVDVEVPAESGVPGTVTAEVQPSNLTDRILFLLITAGEYTDDLTYEVVDNLDVAIAGLGGPFELDQPQLLAGAGAMGVLGAAPQYLRFSNNTSNAINVQILVGRQAYP